MAAIKTNLKHQLPASSILEVVVSMVIIVMVLGISLMIYSNVVRQSLSANQLKAQFLLQQAMLKAEAGTLKETEVIDEWQITQDIKAYETGTGLISVHLSAYDDNHTLIAEASKIIVDHEKE